MAIQEKLYTSADLWEIASLPENDLKHFVLIDGAIFEMPPPTWLHGIIVMAIARLIANFASDHKLGMVTAAETGYDFAPGTTLAPDVGFVIAARIPQDLPSRYFPGAPDLAVEVISPSERPSEIRAKIEKYMLHGTRLLWIVYPEDQKVDVYRPGEGSKANVEFLANDGTLDGGDLLPGFKLPLREVFSQAENPENKN
jgi:Uma2 family endonuclease